MRGPITSASPLFLLPFGLCGAALLSCGGSSGGQTYPCSPTSTCKAGADCISTADNKSLTSFGLRMSQINFTSPTVLAQGLFSQLFQGFVEPNLASCNLPGMATFNWLLQFDTGASTLRTGGAAPVADPTTGYAFTNQMLSGLQVQPVSYSVSLDSAGKFSTSTGQDLVMPVYLDSMGMSAVLLPLRKVVFSGGQLSTDHNCIGSYNAQGLSTSNMCMGTDTVPQFLTGAQVSGVISLQDADTVPITTLGETLCVLLSGDPTLYGDTSSPKKCKRDANTGSIVFKGDWCAATNSAATGTCADAVHVTASFAASGVKITG